jgi:hypothetical protein
VSRLLSRFGNKENIVIMILYGVQNNAFLHFAIFNTNILHTTLFLKVDKHLILCSKSLLQNHLNLFALSKEGKDIHFGGIM